MFPRVTQVKNKQGAVRSYLQILESYYEQGKRKHHVVANLGRLDEIGDKLPALLKSLSRFTEEPWVTADDLRAEEALSWGTILLSRTLYDRLNLGEIIRQHAGSVQQKFDVGETAFVLVANRLTDPSSEHGLARWLEQYYVCDRNGRRWVPEWLPEEAITRKRRVRVEDRQLNGWYRTLDALWEGKREIERDLYLRVRDLFSLQVDMVFYDVTSTYFARRRAKGELRRHGYSRDGKPRNVQVVVGVVIANGWPIAHHVFAGDTADKKTFRGVVEDVEGRFGLRRVLVVGDRGMVSEENLEFLGEGGREVRYLLGVPGRQSKEAREVLGKLEEGRWERVDGGNRVQEVRLDESGVRYFVVESAERREYEEELRRRSMERVRARLEKIVEAVGRGRLNDKVKLAGRAARAMQGDHASRYYAYEIGEGGGFRYWEDEEKLGREREREGKYILKTDDGGMEAGKSVEIYKQLSEVEWAYRDLKDVIEMRPVYHKTDRRVEAHIFVATLALFLKRTLEHELEARGEEMSGTEALAAMRSMGVGIIEVGEEKRLLVSRGGRDARRLVKVLGIEDIEPPKATGGVRTGVETAM